MHLAVVVVVVVVVSGSIKEDGGEDELIEEARDKRAHDIMIISSHPIIIFHLPSSIFHTCINFPVPTRCSMPIKDVGLQ